MDQLLRRLILLILFLSQVTVAALPGELSGKKLEIGAGWSHMGLRDRGISPLYYSGSQVLFKTRLTADREKTVNRTGINIMHGKISPALGNSHEPPSMMTIRGELQFSHLRKISDVANSTGRICLGLAVNSQYMFYEHSRMSNSSSNNIFITTLNLKGEISFPVNFLRGAPEISFSGFFPVIAGIIRPSYAYIKPEGYLEHQSSNLSKLLNSIEISSVNRFAGAATETSISFTTGSGSDIIMSYRWGFFEHSQVNSLQSAIHGINIAYTFQF